MKNDNRQMVNGKSFGVLGLTAPMGKAMGLCMVKYCFIDIRVGRMKKWDRAPDGIIESVSGSNREHWNPGVPWHPESSFAWDDFSRKLFAYFLARCRAARGMDEGTHTQNP